MIQWVKGLLHTSKDLHSDPLRTHVKPGPEERVQLPFRPPVVRRKAQSESTAAFRPAWWTQLLRALSQIRRRVRNTLTSTTHTYAHIVCKPNKAV